MKQKSESEADILLSFDQSSRKGGPNRCWLAGSNVLGPLDRCRNATSGLIAKPVRRTAFAADWAPTCWRVPVTCERGRNASLKCVSPARSHTNRVPTPWRSLSGCHGIQHPGSGKKPVSRVRRQLAVQIPGFRSLLTESPQAEKCEVSHCRIPPRC